MPTIVMDGNFVSEHLRMRNPSEDVFFSDGHGFMATSGPYEAHLKAANDTREVKSDQNKVVSLHTNEMTGLKMQRPPSSQKRKF